MIQSRESENEAELRRLEVARERATIEAETERERVRLRLEAVVEEAKALERNPALLKLRQLDALRDMARSGGRFFIGLDREGLGSVVAGDD